MGGVRSVERSSFALLKADANLPGVIDADTARSRGLRTRGVVWIGAALLVTVGACRGGLALLRAQGKAQDGRERASAAAALTT